MKVKQVAEIQSLDDELNLFDESDWDFMSVVEEQANNYEYFVDVRDTDFERRGRFPKSYYIAVACLVSLVVFCVVVTLRVTHVFDRSEYDAINNMQSVMGGSGVSYADGREATSEELLGINTLFSSYFRILRQEKNYSPLYDLCSQTSDFADTYYAETSKVEVLYDDSDCYARSLREFAGFCNLNKIVKVIEKDGVYYCYLDVSMPTQADITEYVYLYSYNFTKQFNNSLPTRAGVVKFLLETTAENPVPCTSREICIQVEDTSAGYKITSDTLILETCRDAYITAISKISDILGSTLTGK